MYTYTYLLFVINTKYRRNTIIGNTFVNTYRTIAVEITGRYNEIYVYVKYVDARWRCKDI